MKYIGHLFFVVFIISKKFRTWIFLLLLFGYHHLIWAKHLSVSPALCRIFNLFILYTNVLFNRKTDLSPKPGFRLSMKYDPEFADGTIIHLLWYLCLALWFVARIWSTGKLRFHMLFTSEKFVFSIQQQIQSVHEIKYVFFSDFSLVYLFNMFPITGNAPCIWLCNVRLKHIKFSCLDHPASARDSIQ